MKTQKILILGITGNLAKLKILPAIGQYFDLHNREVNIEIYGYSRSKANLEEIESLIRSQIKPDLNQPISGVKTKFAGYPKITLVQGEYSDKTFYDQLVGSLTDNDSLAIYLAVPPSVYTNFLENSCPYSKRPIDILIEKPFGESLEEGQRIMEIVAKCDLHQRVHFLDHYLFKSGLQINIEKVKEQLQKQNLTFDNIKSIDIFANETVDAKERGGYYDDNGAIKDMFPHLYSLYNFGMDFFANKVQNDWSVVDMGKSQYDGYKADVNNPNSTTETSFFVILKNQISQTNSFNLALASGKKAKQKWTNMTILFNNKYRLELELFPNNTLELIDDQNIIINSFAFNLDDKLDHTRVFEDVFAGDFDRFVPNDKVLEYWQVYQKIAEASKTTILN
jgi:glucose-6-phosphate 1-dehydrogenase